MYEEQSTKYNILKNPQQMSIYILLKLIQPH